MKLLLTGAARFNDEQKKHLEDLGHELFFLQYEKDVPPLKYDEIDGVIGNGLFLHHNIGLPSQSSIQFLCQLAY